MKIITKYISPVNSDMKKTAALQNYTFTRGLGYHFRKSKFPVLILTSKQPSEFEKAEAEERFEDSEARAKEDIDNVVPPESDARNYSGHGPSPNGSDENINGEGLVSAEPAMHEEGDTRMVEIGEERGAGEGED